MVNFLCVVSRHSDEDRPFILGVIDFTSGSLAAIANAMIGLPLDTVKVKMQTFPLLYGGAWNCFRDVIHKYGVSGLYAGATPCIVAEVSEKSVLFCAHGYCQYLVSRITGNSDTPSAFENAMAGFFAGFFSSFTLCPTEMIKCKLQALRDLGHPVENLRPYKIINDIIATHGILGMYTGLSSTLVREMPGYFFYFGGYQLARNYLTDNNQHDKTIWKIALSGAVGGVACWATIYPMDLIKTRAQVSENRQSLRSAVMLIIKSEGFFGLYRGIWPSLIRTFPATGSLFVVYEYSVRYMTNAADTYGLLP